VNRVSHGAMCSAYSGLTYSGPSSASSNFGTLQIVAGDASGNICSVAMCPALPNERRRVHRRQAGTQLQAQ
jgi:hypothetical protein